MAYACKGSQGLSLCSDIEKMFGGQPLSTPCGLRILGTSQICVGWGSFVPSHLFNVCPQCQET